MGAVRCSDSSNHKLKMHSNSKNTTNKQSAANTNNNYPNDDKDEVELRLSVVQELEVQIVKYCCRQR